MPRSYIPDGNGLSLSELPDGLMMTGKTEPGTGIRKRIEVQLSQDKPQVYLRHTLTNEGLWPVELAPWALTMFRLGGKVIIPTRCRNGGEDGLLPDRHISLWPYSKVEDPRLHLSDEYIVLETKPDLPPFKIGTFAPQGWIAYSIEGLLFRNSFDVSPGGKYPDYGCNVESYCDNEFVELESLGPLAKLKPGEMVEHVERWEIEEE
jgi:hypothetical protein